MKNIRPFNQITPEIAPSAYVDPAATIIGNVSIGNDSSIWPNVSIRGDLLKISIGNNSNVQDNSVIHTTRFYDKSGKGFDVVVGDGVTIGHSVTLHGCHIGNRVLVGMGAIVLDGVVVEDDVMIAAGSVVTPGKRLQSGYLYLGSPAKQARALTDAEKDMIKKNAIDYVETKNQYQIG
ncbi:MAG: gamma carbonic anhydrase family protein [Francisellaceae bacterium]